MAETVGSLIDKLSILELRRFHVFEVLANEDASEAAKQACRARLPILEAQREDLMAELDETWCRVRKGFAPKVYRQYKMYNDAGLREGSSRLRRTG